MTSILLMRKLRPKEARNQKQTYVTPKQEKKNHTTLPPAAEDGFLPHPRKLLAVLEPEAN